MDLPNRISSGPLERVPRAPSSRGRGAFLQQRNAFQPQGSVVWNHPNEPGTGMDPATGPVSAFSLVRWMGALDAGLHSLTNVAPHERGEEPDNEDEDEPAVGKDFGSAE